MTPRTDRMQLAVDRVDYLMTLARIANYTPVMRALEHMPTQSMIDVVVILASDLVCSGYRPELDGIDSASIGAPMNQLGGEV